MKKVLVFIDWYLPAYKAGGPISSVSNMIELLLDDISFFIVTGNRDLNSDEPLIGVESNIWQKVKNANVIYLDKKSQNLKFLKKIVDEIQPNKIYLNGIFSSFFSIFICYFFKNKIKIIINPRGMFGPKALSIKSLKKSIFIKLVNFFSFYKGIHWHVSNENELKELYNNIKGVDSISIIPNLPRDVTFFKKVKQKENELKLVSVCRVNEIKNLEFILKLLKDLSIKCSYKVIGFIEDENYYNKLKLLVQSMPENINIEFTGLLPKITIDSELKKADLFISSSLNENYGHSIVESLAAGVPVLISDHCPWMGLEDSNAGFRLPLDRNKFKEKLLFFHTMTELLYSKYNLGSRSYFDKFISSEIHKNNYINLFSN
jgi:glycosyltransferase involved in cell wall biosynthesis